MRIREEIDRTLDRLPEEVLFRVLEYIRFLSERPLAKELEEKDSSIGKYFQERTRQRRDFSESCTRVLIPADEDVRRRVGRMGGKAERSSCHPRQ